MIKLKNRNIPNIKFSDRFDKHLRNVSDEIKTAFLETLDLFLEDQNYPVLRNHSLKENFAGYRSINVTDDYRAVFKETQSGEQKIITFHMLGMHRELYGT